MALYRLVNGRSRDLRLELLSPSREALQAQGAAWRAEQAAIWAELRSSAEGPGIVPAPATPEPRKPLQDKA